MSPTKNPFSANNNSSPQKTGFSLGLVLLIALLAIVLLTALLAIVITSCQPEPTPTPTPFPTRTRTPRSTRTPFPTLTPRIVATPTVPLISGVVTDTLRVREQPSTSARILGRLRTDSVVRLLSRTDDNQWYAIEYPPDTGQVGWVFAPIVIPRGDVALLPVGFVAPKPPPGSIFALVNSLGDPLRVRAGPGTNYEVVSRIPDQSRVTLLARSPDGTWYQVAYPPESGERGWVSGDFVTLDGSPDAMQIAQAPPTPTPAPTTVPRPTRAANIPLGGTILASSNRSGGYDIFALGENGVSRGQLTRSGSAFAARYSPDGERIVFHQTVATAPAVVNHIFGVDFDGGGLQDLSARAGGGYSDTDPDWSPDGQRIVFVRTPRAGAPEIWVMNRDGSGARRLIRLTGATGIVDEYSPTPRWSPDGGRIAYAAVPRVASPGAPLYPSIFTIGVNGDGERQLTNNDLINTGPVWSPDGAQIAWSAKDFIKRENWRTWVMNASGSDQRIIFGAPGGDPNNGAQPAAWRGSQLLISGWTGNWNAYLGAAEGGTLTRITSGRADTIPTDWLP